MKLSARVLHLIPIVLAVFAGLTALFETLAYLISYEAPNANYFAVGSALPGIAAVLALLVCLAGILLAYLLPKNPPAFQSLPVRKATLPAAAGFFFGALVLLLSGSVSTGTVVTVFFLLLAAVYAVMSAFLSSRYPAATALVGFAAVLGCILLDALYYFDRTLEMNAPVKVTVLIGILCVMLYHTGEIRYLLDRAAPRVYLMLSFWVLGVGALSALPVPIAALAGKFARETSPADASLLSAVINHPEYLAGALIVLGTSITAGIRLRFLFHPKAPVSGSAPSDVSESDPSSEETSR